MGRLKKVEKLEVLLNAQSNPGRNKKSTGQSLYQVGVEMWVGLRSLSGVVLIGR
jgi:hypothetical protein